MSNMFDAFKMLGKLGDLKKKANEVKEQLKDIEITEVSDDQLVKVVLTADKNIKKIDISDNLMSPAAKEDLEKKMVETINVAFQTAEKKGKEILNESLKDSLPDIPGLDMDNLPI